MKYNGRERREKEDGASAPKWHEQDDNYDHCYRAQCTYELICH